MATISLGKITQGELGTLTFTWSFPEYITSPASVSGAVITATMTDEDGTTTAVSGTLTGTAATTATWALSAGDSGTAGTFTVIFRAVVSGVTTYTLEATLEVINNPSATGTQNEPLVSISAADAAWVTLAATAVPDGGDVVDANDLGTAAYAATGDFDAAGAAAAAQAAAVQRANHTGTQLLATISDVTATGSSIAKAASVDAARSVIGLPSVTTPPRDVELVSLATWTTENAAGSGAASIVNASYISIDSGATASSTIGLRSPVFFVSYNSNFASWNRKIECYGRINLINTDAAGKIRIFVGKASGTFGTPASGDYVALEIVGSNVTSGYVCNNGTLATVALTSTSISSGGDFYIVSNNGSVQWYIGGVLIGQSTAGPVLANRTGAMVFEIENASARCRATMWAKTRGY